MKKLAEGLFWWGVTIVTLFILDDLVFGPLFWALSIRSKPLSTALAFVASWCFGIWLIDAGVRDNPSKLASWFLNRLMLERKNGHISVREDSIKKQAASSIGAVLVTPLIGAVIPVLLLDKRRRMTGTSLRIHAFGLTALYAVEFALLHGGYGIGGLVRVITGAIF